MDRAFVGNLGTDFEITVSSGIIFEASAAVLDGQSIIGLGSTIVNTLVNGADLRGITSTTANSVTSAVNSTIDLRTAQLGDMDLSLMNGAEVSLDLNTSEMTHHITHVISNATSRFVRLANLDGLLAVGDQLVLNFTSTADSDDINAAFDLTSKVTSLVKTVNSITESGVITAVAAACTVGTVVARVTLTDHGLVTGDTITVTGVSFFNGTDKSIVRTSANEFTYTVATAASGSDKSGNITIEFNNQIKLDGSFVSRATAAATSLKTTKRDPITFAPTGAAYGSRYGLATKEHSITLKNTNEGTWAARTSSTAAQFTLNPKFVGVIDHGAGEIFCVEMNSTSTIRTPYFATTLADKSQIVIAVTKLKMQQFITTQQEDCLVLYSDISASTHGKDITYVHQSIEVDIYNVDSTKNIDMRKLNNTKSFEVSGSVSSSINARVITLDATPISLVLGSSLFRDSGENIGTVVLINDKVVTLSTNLTAAVATSTKLYSVNKYPRNYVINNSVNLMTSTNDGGINYKVNSGHVLEISKTLANNRTISGLGTTIIAIRGADAPGGTLSNLNVENVTTAMREINFTENVKIADTVNLTGMTMIVDSDIVVEFNERTVAIPASLQITAAQNKGYVVINKLKSGDNLTGLKGRVHVIDNNLTSPGAGSDSLKLGTAQVHMTTAHVAGAGNLQTLSARYSGLSTATKLTNLSVNVTKAAFELSTLTTTKIFLNPLELGILPATGTNAGGKIQNDDYSLSANAAQTTTTVTVTLTNHGLTANDKIKITSATASFNTGWTAITITDADTFTYTGASSATVTAGTSWVGQVQNNAYFLVENLKNTKNKSAIFRIQGDSAGVISMVGDTPWIKAENMKVVGTNISWNTVSLAEADIERKFNDEGTFKITRIFKTGTGSPTSTSPYSVDATTTTWAPVVIEKRILVTSTTTTKTIFTGSTTVPLNDTALSMTELAATSATMALNQAFDATKDFIFSVPVSYDLELTKIPTGVLNFNNIHLDSTRTAILSSEDTNYQFSQVALVAPATGINALTTSTFAASKIYISESDQSAIELDVSAAGKYIITNYSGINSSISPNNNDSEVTLQFNDNMIANAATFTSDNKYEILAGKSLTASNAITNFPGTYANNISGNGTGDQQSKLIVTDYASGATLMTNSSVSSTLNTSLKLYTSADQIKSINNNLAENQFTSITKSSTVANRFNVVGDIYNWQDADNVVIRGGSITGVTVSAAIVTLEEGSVYAIDNINTADNTLTLKKGSNAVTFTTSNDVVCPAGVRFEFVSDLPTNVNFNSFDTITIQSNGYSQEYSVLGNPVLEWVLQRTDFAISGSNLTTITIPNTGWVSAIGIESGERFDLDITRHFNNNNAPTTHHFEGVSANDNVTEQNNSCVTSRIYVDGTDINIKQDSSGNSFHYLATNSFVEKLVVKLTYKHAYRIAKPNNLIDGSMVKIGSEFATVNSVALTTYDNVRTYGKLEGGIINQGVYKFISTGKLNAAGARNQVNATTSSKTGVFSATAYSLGDILTETNIKYEVIRLDPMDATTWYRFRHNLLDRSTNPITAISHVISRGSNYNLTVDDTVITSGKNPAIKADADASNTKSVQLTVKESAGGTIDLDNFSFENIDSLLINAIDAGDKIVLGKSLLDRGVLNISLDPSTAKLQTIEVDLSDYVSMTLAAGQTPTTIFNEYRDKAIKVTDFNAEDRFSFIASRGVFNDSLAAIYVNINYSDARTGNPQATVLPTNPSYQRIYEFINTAISGGFDWDDDFTNYTDVKANLTKAGANDIWNMDSVTSDTSFLIYGTYRSKSVIYFVKILNNADKDFIIIPIIETKTALSSPVNQIN